MTVKHKIPASTIHKTSLTLSGTYLLKKLSESGSTQGVPWILVLYDESHGILQENR